MLKTLFKNKKLLIINLLLLILMSFNIVSCSPKGSSVNKSFTRNAEASKVTKSIENVSGKKMGVVYFSITGNTEKVANKIAETFALETVKLEPEIPYKDSDFIEGNPNTRPIRESRFNLFGEEEYIEQEYPTSFGVLATKPELESVLPKATELPQIKKINANRYNIIFLGYPIWYGDAPRVVYSFVKDLRNVTIIPFCTSDNDDIYTSEANIANYVDESVRVMSGKRFDINVSSEELKYWVKDLSVDIK